VAAPSTPQRVELAWSLLRGGRPDLAEQQARDALAEDPEHADAHAALAEALRRNGRLAEALAEARRSVQLDPNLAVGHRVGSITLNQLGDTTRAERAARNAINLEPESPEGYALLGNVYLAQGRHAAAIKYADEALQLNPHHNLALRIRAHSLSRQGLGREASEAARQALATQPEAPQGHLTHARLELQHGDAETAAAAYREALRLDPTSTSARDGLLTALAARNVIYRLLLRASNKARNTGHEPIIVHAVVSPLAAASWSLPDAAATALLTTGDGRLLNPPRERAWRAAAATLAIAGIATAISGIWLGLTALLVGLALYFAAVPISEARTRPWPARRRLLALAAGLPILAIAAAASSYGRADLYAIGLMAVTPIIASKLATG
jgi:tetratricopeptide (TPR) repeat protein